MPVQFACAATDKVQQGVVEAFGDGLQDVFQSLAGPGEGTISLLHWMPKPNRAIGYRGRGTGQTGGFVGADWRKLAGQVSFHLHDAVEVIDGGLPELVESAVEVFRQGLLGADLRAGAVQRVLAKPSRHLLLRLLHRRAVLMPGGEVIKPSGNLRCAGFQRLGLGHPEANAFREALGNALLVIADRLQFLAQRLVGSPCAGQFRHAGINQVRQLVGGDFDVGSVLDARLFVLRAEKAEAILALYSAFIDRGTQGVSEVLDDRLAADRRRQVGNARRPGFWRAHVIHERRVVLAGVPCAVLDITGHCLSIRLDV